MVVGGVVVSFTVLGGIIIVLAKAKIISGVVALLMLAALLGMYIGFGTLVAVYRLLGKLK
jgi:hypothetical protein